MVGGVPVGGGAPVSIQSMLNTRTTDAEGSLRQIRALAAAGCRDRAAGRAGYAGRRGLRRDLQGRLPLPLVADIHFDYRLAIARGRERCSQDPHQPRQHWRSRRGCRACGQMRCSARHIPIRIGVNGGSLEKRAAGKIRPPHAGGAGRERIRPHRAAGEMRFPRHLRVNEVQLCTADRCEAYRLFSERSDYPLHVGVTETGARAHGRLSNPPWASAALLCQGIGDTMRVSLTGRSRAGGDSPQKISCKQLSLRKDGVNISRLPDLRTDAAST